MKKIVPFNKTLDFITDVSEITSISLDHKITKSIDSISGNFYISGEYKIMDGGLDKERFDFDLPFDIALSNEYDLDTLLVDIDDFRYNLINKNQVKVNIDLYLEGDIIEREIPPILDRDIELEDNDTKKIEIEEHNNDISNTSNDTFITYNVYRVCEGDTIDNIVEKYQVSKESILEYNSFLDNIIPGDKLIIPSK